MLLYYYIRTIFTVATKVRTLNLTKPVHALSCILLCKNNGVGKTGEFLKIASIFEFVRLKKKKYSSKKRRTQKGNTQ